jgi:hypothetical protein
MPFILFALLAVLAVVVVVLLVYLLLRHWLVSPPPTHAK